MSKINEAKKNYGYHVSWHDVKDPISHTSYQTAIIIHTGSLTLEIQNGACQEIITDALNALRYLC